MTIEIAYHASADGNDEVWCGHAGTIAVRLCTLTGAGDRDIVDRWAAQADSVPEFLEMLHLEGLIDLDRYYALLRQHDPLYAAAWAMLACLPHRRIRGQVEDPTRELFPLIERMAQALEPFVSDPIVRAILADALGTYWGSWEGRYEHLDHEVNAARQALNEAMTGARGGIRILCPGDITLTPEAVQAMISYVLAAHARGEA
jgi:hypothetical protein